MTQTNKEREEYENFEAWLCTLNSFSPSELRFGFLAWQAAKQSPISQNEQQDEVINLWECLGKWSAYLVSNGDKSNLAPPSWLVDAVRNATSPPKQAIPEDILEKAIFTVANCEYQKTLDSEQIKHFNAGVAALYDALKAAPTNTEVGE